MQSLSKDKLQLQQIVQQINEYFDAIDLHYVLPEDKEHEYFASKKKIIFEHFQPANLQRKSSKLFKRRMEALKKKKHAKFIWATDLYLGEIMDQIPFKK